MLFSLLLALAAPFHLGASPAEAHGGIFSMQPAEAHGGIFSTKPAEAHGGIFVVKKA